MAPRCCVPCSLVRLHTHTHAPPPPSPPPPRPQELHQGLRAKRGALISVPALVQHLSRRVLRAAVRQRAGAAQAGGGGSDDAGESSDDDCPAHVADEPMEYEEVRSRGWHALGP
jgi:hypothetical protein